MSVNKAIARNTFIQIAGKGLSTVIGIVTVALLARGLGPAGYGQLTLVLGFLAIFATLVDFGLTLTTTQMISEDHERETEILGNLMTVRLISGALFLSLAPIVAIFFPYEPLVKVAIAIGALSYFFMSNAQVLIGVFQKNMSIEKSVFGEVGNRIVVLVGAYLATQYSLSLTDIMWFFVAGNLFHFGSSLMFARGYSAFKPRVDLTLWREIFSRSWPIGASIFFNLIYLKGDIVFLSLFTDDTEIGLYGIAYKVIDVLSSVPVMFMGLVLPLLVMYWSQKKTDDYKNLMQNTFDFFSLFGLPVVAGSMLVGTEAIVFVAGEEFAAAGPVLLLLGPALLAVFYGALFGHAIVSLNLQRKMVPAYAAVAVITIIGYLTTIPVYGMYGAAFWTLASEALIALIAAVVVFRVSKVRISYGMFLKALIAAGLMCLAIVAMPEAHVMVDVGVGAAVYIAAVQILGGPGIKDALRLIKS